MEHIERPHGSGVRVAIVVGTRPEAIKVAPLILAARDRADIQCRLIATGQHGALFDDALAQFGLTADETLGSADAGLTIDALAARIARTLPPALDRWDADIVVVQGDTTSAWAAARVAQARGYPVAHVEAGLRSGDPLRPWPEEPNRIAIDRIADLLFAPCPAAADNLRREGVAGDVMVTGNSGIDALLWMRERVPPAKRSPGVHRLFVTCHRRESQGAALEAICTALRRLAARRDVAMTLALPGDPEKQKQLFALLAGAPIALVPPLTYGESVTVLMGADLVLSDSGGLQEECPALGVPLLVLRDTSERPEAIACGNARLVGTDAEAIATAATRLLDEPTARAAMARPTFPYGTGDAAPKMIDALVAFVSARASDRSRRFG